MSMPHEIEGAVRGDPTVMEAGQDLDSLLQRARTFRTGYEQALKALDEQEVSLEVLRRQVAAFVESATEEKRRAVEAQLQKSVEARGSMQLLATERLAKVEEIEGQATEARSRLKDAMQRKYSELMLSRNDG